MTEYSIMKLRQHVYKDDQRNFDNYERLHHLITNYMTIRREIASALDRKMKNNENEIDEEKFTNEMYDQIIEVADLDFFQYFNLSKSYIERIINQNIQLAKKDPDINFKVAINKDYYLRLYESDVMKRLLNRGMIVFNKTFNSVVLNFYDPYDPLSIQRIQMEMSNKYKKHNIDIYYKKKIQDVQKNKKDVASIFYDNNGIAIVTGQNQYYFDFKDFKNQFEACYLELNNKESMLRHFYDRQVNKLYVFLSKIYHHIILKQEIETLVIYDNNYINNSNVDIDDLNEKDHFSQIFTDMIYYLSNAYMINVKRYRLNEDIVKYVPIFNMNVLRDQNVKIQNVDVEENERQVIFDQTKEHIIPVVLNAAFNLKRHYEKDFEIDESRYEYKESDFNHLVDTRDVYLGIEY